MADEEGVLEETMWNAYVMMLENDGKNVVQLVEWAGLDVWADKYVRVRLWENVTETGWPVVNECNALALWLLWMSEDEGELCSIY